MLYFLDCAFLATLLDTGLYAHVITVLKHNIIIVSVPLIPALLPLTPAKIPLVKRISNIRLADFSFSYQDVAFFI